MNKLFQTLRSSSLLVVMQMATPYNYASVPNRDAPFLGNSGVVAMLLRWQHSIPKLSLAARAGSFERSEQ